VSEEGILVVGGVMGLKGVCKEFRVEIDIFRVSFETFALQMGTFGRYLWFSRLILVNKSLNICLCLQIFTLIIQFGSSNFYNCRCEYLKILQSF